MAEKTTIARPYAQAVFDLARHPRAGAADLRRWSAMLHLAVAVSSDPQLQALIGDPRIGTSQLVSLLLDVCGTGLDADGQNFIRLLVENRRLTVLPEILALYEMQRADAEGVVHAEVISAQALTATQQADIGRALQVRLGRAVTLSCSINVHLLGGAIIRAGDRVMDGSARGQLHRLASALARA